MNDSELLEAIEMNLYRFFDTLNCIKEYNTYSSKCHHYMLSLNVVELCYKEKKQILNELQDLIIAFLPIRSFYNPEENKIIRIVKKFCMSGLPVCQWRFNSNFGFCELTLNLKGFDKNTAKYNCLIELFRNCKCGKGTFNYCGYDGRKDKFYITYYLE